MFGDLRIQGASPLSGLEQAYSLALQTSAAEGLDISRVPKCAGPLRRDCPIIVGRRTGQHIEHDGCVTDCLGDRTATS